MKSVNKINELNKDIRDIKQCLSKLSSMRLKYDPRQVLPKPVGIRKYFSEMISNLERMRDKV